MGELPNDGWPRITSDGIDILEEGLRGDFSRWEHIGWMNHPKWLPGCTRNCNITCDPKEMHFSVQFWYGRWPAIKEMSLAPNFSFNEVDRMEAYDPRPGYIVLRLRKGDTWDWYSNVHVLVDDAYSDEKRKTDYSRGQPVEYVPDEDDENEEEQADDRNQRTLEAWI